MRRADRHSIPKVDNTNVDRSVATIHATLTGALRRREQVQKHPLQGGFHVLTECTQDACGTACNRVAHEAGMQAWRRMNLQALFSLTLIAATSAC